MTQADYKVADINQADFGRKENRPGPERNAGADGLAQAVQRRAAPEGRQDHRLYST